MTDSINVPLLEGNIPGQGVSVPFHPDVTEWHKPGLVAENHLHHFREGYLNLRLLHILAALLKSYRSEFWETHPLCKRIPYHPDAALSSHWKTRCKSLAVLGTLFSMRPPLSLYGAHPSRKPGNNSDRGLKSNMIKRGGTKNWVGETPGNSDPWAREKKCLNG